MERFYLQAALVFLTVIVALTRGSREHRVVASTIAAMFLVSTGFALTAGHASDWAGIPVHRVLIDTAALLVFVKLWLESDRWWVLLISSAQLLAVWAHAARILSLPLPPLGYAVMEIWPFWLVIVITLTSAFRTRN